MTVTRSRHDLPPESGEQEQQSSFRSGLTWLFWLPRSVVRQVRQTAARTPGRLTLIAAGLVALIVATGIAATIVAQDKRSTITNLADYQEPLSSAAGQIYRSLSDANATAATAFLGGGVEKQDQRRRFEDDIAKAGAALSKATSDEGTESEADRLVKTLSTQLPVYSGLIETARANNRQGLPVGGAYLREASGLMVETILPAARELYVISSQKLAEEQDEANSFPITTTVLVLGLLVSLVATQRYLARKTNRVFNKGLVVATVAVVAGLLWGSAAMITQSVLVDNARDQGSTQVDALTRARIAALQGRAAETLALVSRGGAGQYTEAFARAERELVGSGGGGGLLAEARQLAEGTSGEQHVVTATKRAQEWLTRHEKIDRLASGGDYEQAVQIAVGNAERGSSTVFGELDSSLSRAISVGREQFRSGTVNGARALLFLAPGVAVLTVVAAGGTAVGIRERQREYL